MPVPPPPPLAAFPGRAASALPPPWTTLRYVPQTGSTNADLLADPDGPVGEVLVTDHQTAGRGRLDRRWEEPPGASVMFSVRWRPGAPVTSWGWMPLLTGVAFVDAVRVLAPSVPVGLKWPNDVLLGADDRKVAGILVEARGSVVVIGAGCNVLQSRAELPVPTATSLALEGVEVDRAALLAELLAGLAARLTAWEAAGGDARAAGLHEAYVARCRTLGRPVVVSRPAGDLVGEAVRVDDTAGLVVATPAGETTVVAGDVTHVRPVG